MRAVICESAPEWNPAGKWNTAIGKFLNAAIGKSGLEGGP